MAVIAEKGKLSFVISNIARNIVTKKQRLADAALLFCYFKIKCPLYASLERTEGREWFNLLFLLYCIL